MDNFQIFKNQLENTINMDSQQFSKNLNNQLNAEKLGYQNSSNETLYKGSNFIDDSFKKDLDIIWKDNGLDFEAIKAPLFYKGTNGELIEVKDHQAIINNQNNNLLNIPKLQYTTLQLSTIRPTSYLGGIIGRRYSSCKTIEPHFLIKFRVDL